MFFVFFVLLQHKLVALTILTFNDITFNLIVSNSDSKRQWIHINWWTRWTGGLVDWWTGLNLITVWYLWYFYDRYLSNYSTDLIETRPIRTLMPKLYHESVVRTPIRCLVFENYWSSSTSSTLEYVIHPHSTEYCKNISEIFPIFHCKWNIVATFLSNIAKYFIAMLQF